MGMPTLDTPRSAATVVVVRDHADGLQVLLLRRHRNSGFAPGMWVFPGGTVDDGDRTFPPGLWTGVDLDTGAEQLGVAASDALGLYVAAVRETFEESGLLVGADAGNGVVAAGAHRALDGTSGSFATWLDARGLQLNLGSLTFFARWITPTGRPKRYDTWFFVASAGGDEAIEHDGQEMIASAWVSPAAALSSFRSGEVALMTPTFHTLRWLTRFSCAEDVVRAASIEAERRAIEPTLLKRTDTEVVLVPEHAPTWQGLQ